MKKILKMLWIAQEVSNKDREPKLGEGYFTAVRLNPYNPLSYIALVFICLAILIWKGISGFIEIFEYNPFKWR